ncbi:phosphatidylserine decarboxylase family protein [Caulobacter sp. S45]|uniref:phosphatidylserine decarboxylase family protein n=1 Tax=Caulobacter sp. S45 TaxID=1641861 RepID=UPI001C20971D|nr:phosphatidylserine decarboxylase family protein [Caulobacter sp. S45]
MPSDPEVHRAWLQELIKDSIQAHRPLHPVIARFEAFIEGDAEVYMLFHQMFEQASNKAPYADEAAGEAQVRDYKTLLRLFDVLLTRAPEYNRSGVVGVPFNAILDRAMGTPAGFAAFLNAKVNGHLKAMLDAWGRFLTSPDSRAVLNDDPHKGWFGKDALQDMPHFDEDFLCHPTAPHKGFQSWDDFFTRQFRPGVRPVSSPNDDAIIVNPCEAAPYRIATGIARRDRFWIKGQRYSLEHMLAGDSLAPEFVGGTAYQAYLSALSYHRWHAPVSGTVVKAYLQPGTYYSETLSEADDPSGPTESQGYLAEIATRGLIFIEADNPAIGLMCFMPVGMGDVSTCDIQVYEGQHVGKGDQIGMFHFGGSTMCLLFRPGVELYFDTHGQEPSLQASNIPLCARLATVR